ncbi:hypothetical protein E2C01_021955 [Portunus trituberculatus]|uniref:Ig-like domain-containing protein n=1 Tax=Portunus trituberculatus TaxID=210409 RepID=A0A5B7E7M4_PORTR|nr:hypothetical protein [Portunus trituberculatus]
MLKLAAYEHCCGVPQVLHPASTDEWTLHIRHAQPGDGGWYECQVNSDPKITTPVLLTVRGVGTRLGEAARVGAGLPQQDNAGSNGAGDLH